MPCKSLSWCRAGGVAVLVVAGGWSNSPRPRALASTELLVGEAPVWREAARLPAVTISCFTVM